MSDFLSQLGESFEGALPSTLTGDAPSVQNIASGFRQRGPWGGALNALSQLDNLGEDIARDFTPVGGVQALQSGQLSTGQAAVIGLGTVLGIAGLAGGPRAYSAAKARSGGFNEAGMLDMRQLFPGTREAPLYPPIRAPRRNPTRTHRFDYKTALFLGTRDFDELANVGTLGSTLTPTAKAAYGGFWQGVGRRASQEAPGFVDFPSLGDKGEVAAASLIHSWVDSLDRQGALKGTLGDTYARLRTDPESLFPGGKKSQELVELEELGVTLAREFDDVDSPSLVLPPHKTIAGVEMTPEGPRVAIAHSTVEFRKRWDTELTGDERDRHYWERTFHLNFDALVPDMTSNLLHQMGYLVTPGEVEIGLQWYQRAHDTAVELTDIADSVGRKLSLRQAAGILSLFSGQTEWNENVRIARQFIETGEKPATANTKDFAKAVEILNGAEPSINSDKQLNFFANIERPHDWEPATMDRHAMDAALGFNTFTAGRLLFDHTPTYEAFAEAYKIAAKIEGLITNQVQAITWETTRRTKGLRSADHNLGLGRGEFAYPKNSKDYLEGTVEGDNLLTVIKRAEGNDPGPVAIGLPKQKRVKGKALKGASDWALLESRNPDGSTSLWIGQPSEESSVALRTLRPLFADDEVGLSLLVPSTPRVVESTEEVLRSALDLSADRGATSWPLLERHLGHSPIVPGNRAVAQVPSANAQALKALQEEVRARALPFELRTSKPFQRYEPDLHAARLGPTDIVGLRPRDVQEGKSFLSTNQWVGISAWTGEYDFVPKPNKGSKQARDAAMSQLEKELRRRGYDPIPTKGFYDGEEDSFIVPGMSTAEALELGKKHLQESVVTPHGLIYTNGPNVGKYVKPSGPVEADQAATNYYSVFDVGDGREVKWALPLEMDENFDFVLSDIEGNFDDAIRPSPKTFVQAELDLPDNVPVDIIDELNELFDRFFAESRIDGRKVFYLHGDIGPKGTTRVAEHVVQDAGGRVAIARTRTDSSQDLNGNWAYIDEVEAARLDDFDTGAFTGRRDVADGREVSGATADALLNGELRVLYAHLSDAEEPDFRVSTRNVLKTKVDGRGFRHFAVCLTDGKQPALAFGTDVEEATQVLMRRIGATPGEIVVGTASKDGVVLTPPAHPKDPTVRDRVVGHKVARLLDRFGVELSSIEVLTKVAEAKSR